MMDYYNLYERSTTYKKLMVTLPTDLLPTGSYTYRTKSTRSYKVHTFLFVVLF
jgi:hypothetical protein